MPAIKFGPKDEEEVETNLKVVVVIKTAGLVI